MARVSCDRRMRVGMFCKGAKVGTVWEGGDAWFDDGGDVLERGGAWGDVLEQGGCLGE
jgi:hypothetical protein